jgi:AmmeMemoRadiSam system protein A
VSGLAGREWGPCAGDEDVHVVTTEADRWLLLQIARAAITAHVSGLPAPQVEPDGALARPAGAFVTLYDGAALRGCVGHIEADRPLARVVARAAVAASTADPRFSPVSPTELSRIQIELSILGLLEAITAVEEIEIGRHGLVVEQGRMRGLLLPQVAVEWSWDVHTFIGQTCRKAGLPADAWRRGADIWRFEAEVFGERG